MTSIQPDHLFHSLNPANAVHELIQVVSILDLKHNLTNKTAIARIKGNAAHIHLQIIGNKLGDLAHEAECINTSNPNGCLKNRIVL